MEAVFKLLYRLSTKVYRKRVLITMVCFYSFTLMVLLEFHFTYTKDHYSKSLGVAMAMSRSVKGLSGNVKPKINTFLQKFRHAGDGSLNVQETSFKYQDVKIIDNILFTNYSLDVTQETWRTVTSDRKLYVFSAFFEFYDDRPRVRVLGINGNEYLPKPYCQFGYQSGDIVTVKGTVWMLPDHHEKL